jgi:hypothetical protein
MQREAARTTSVRAGDFRDRSMEMDRGGSEDIRREMDVIEWYRRAPDAPSPLA